MNLIPDDRTILKNESILANMINQERAQHRLSNLSISEVLAVVARKHSDNMAKQKVKFGHGGFDERANTIRKYGIHVAFAENVAYFYNTHNPLLEAVKGWMESPGHRENILGQYDDTGVGIAYDKTGKCFITQLFAKKAT